MIRKECGSGRKQVRKEVVTSGTGRESEEEGAGRGAEEPDGV